MVEPTFSLGLHTLDLLLQSALDRELAGCGLSMAQWTALRAAAEEPGASSADLARACLVTPQTMHTMVSTLEIMGLVVRQPHRVHGRVLQIYLSNAGERRLNDGRVAIAAVEGRTLAVLSDDDREMFGRFISVCIGALTAGSRR